MRLLTKNTLVYLLVTVTVFLLGGLVFYKQLTQLIDEETTEGLFLKKGQVFSYISENHKLPEAVLQKELFSFTKADTPVKETLKDTVLYNSYEEESLPYRELSFAVTIEGQNYKASVRAPLLESEDLVEAVIATLLIISVALLVIMLSVNYFFSKKIWKPFFNTLTALNDYDITKHQAISPGKTNTLEFKKLNEAIQKMTSKISADFQNLKAFTENASHEIQTPLAIIKTKTENLLQSDGLSEELAKQLIEINRAAGRLSKLNQTLLLLTKIENNQFASSEPIDLSKLLHEKIKLFEDLIGIKNFKLESSIESGVLLRLHPALSDIVISNLISNALKYTPEKETIKVELTKNYLLVSNPGSPLKAGAENLFDRFYKENSESTGLGLALVKQIAVLNNHKISYSYLNGLHVFKYEF